MYRTEGIDAIATITELRAKTTELIDHVRQSGNALLIQKNNEPYAVLLNWDTYNALIEHTADRGVLGDREPSPRSLRAAPGSGKAASPG